MPDRDSSRWSRRAYDLPTPPNEQLDQVEGVQEHAGVIPPVTDAIKARHPVVVTGDGLPIDDAGRAISNALQKAMC
jgi:hypothetical protein